MRFTFLPLLPQGGPPLSEIDTIFIRDPKGKRQHILFSSPLKKIHTSLKVGVICIYVFFQQIRIEPSAGCS